jgi:hemoglobin
MRKILLILAIAVFGAGSAFAQMEKPTDKPATETKQKSLYERLGGYDALAAVSDDFIGRLAASKILGRFVVGLSDDSKGKLRQHFVEFLCKATGGSCVYMGRDMKTVHKGLGITEEDWTESVKLLNQTLDKFKVPKPERDEVIAAISGLKGDVVEKK